ncbi:hypothetical protein DL770_003659 [Monosporascus sp. CRB-9-2]|nr:hypothetical protein DL770_003659 [Monosporascus sp. CRB-9-2]
MSYQPLGLMVMPIEDRSPPTLEPVPRKSRTYRSSLTFSQTLAPKNVIATQRFVHYDDKGGADSCVICLEEAAAAIVSLPYSYRFDLDCIRQWFKRWCGSTGQRAGIDGAAMSCHACASSPTDTTRAHRHQVTDVPGRLPLGWLIAWTPDRAEILVGPGHPLMLGRAT